MVTLTLARYTAPGPCHGLSLGPDHSVSLVSGYRMSLKHQSINQSINHLTALYGRTSCAAKGYSRTMGDESISLGAAAGRHSTRLQKYQMAHSGPREACSGMLASAH